MRRGLDDEGRVVRERKDVPVSAGPARQCRSGDGVHLVPGFERSPGDEDTWDADAVVRGRERPDPLGPAVTVQPDRRQAADDRGGGDRHAVGRHVDHHRGVARVAREPVLVVGHERRAGRGAHGDARASLGVVLRRSLAARLVLEEQNAALGRPQQRLQLLEGVDREQLERGDRRADRHPLITAVHSGSAASVAPKYGLRMSWSSREETPRRSR